MIWLILIVLYGLEVNPGNRHQSSPSLIQVWSGSGQTLGHCFAYNAVRSEQHGATLHYPFSWDKVDGTGEPRLLASVEQNHKGAPKMATVVDALLASELPPKSRDSLVPSTSSLLKG